MRRRIFILTGCLAAWAILRSQPITPIVVVGHSMEPTLSPYQVVLGTKDFNEIMRGDVVVFNHDGQRLIKRVLGLPGDKITTFAFGDLYRFARNPRWYQRIQKLNIARRAVTVPPGQLYVVGDNEDVSEDSRLFGPIPASDVDVKILDGGSGAGYPEGQRVAHRLALRKADSGWL